MGHAPAVHPVCRWYSSQPAYGLWHSHGDKVPSFGVAFGVNGRSLWTGYTSYVTINDSGQPVQQCLFARLFFGARGPIFGQFDQTGSHRAQCVASSGRFFWGAALLGPPLIRVMTPEQFHEAAPLVPILAREFLPRGLYYLFGTEIFYSKKTFLVPILSAQQVHRLYGLPEAREESRILGYVHPLRFEAPNPVPRVRALDGSGDRVGQKAPRMVGVGTIGNGRTCKDNGRPMQSSHLLYPLIE